MIRTIVSIGALAVLTTAATAQQPCGDNAYKLWLTDAAGTPAPSALDPALNTNVSQFDREAVYLAFDPTLPSGTYYVHVTDRLNGVNDMVLSTNDPMDRFVHVENNGGVITLSLPMSTNSPVLGQGLNGVGQSLLLQPITANPNEPCTFKAWFGDAWNLSEGPDFPYVVTAGMHPTANPARCAIRSYEYFRIGDGSGSDVSGDLFHDDDRDGARDPGENGLANWEVRLVGGSATLTTSTDGNGHYVFADVPAGTYDVELVLQPTFITTTDNSFTIESCGCADVTIGEFGVASSMLTCEARNLRYWKSCAGLHLVGQLGLLSSLPALGIVNTFGRRVAPCNLYRLRRYLCRTNSWNMAYSLSSQVVAMHFNLAAGYVDPNCVIDDPCLGQMTIDQLMQNAVLSLWAHRYTPWCSSHRAAQTSLRNALHRANCNQIWR